MIVTIFQNSRIARFSDDEDLIEQCIIRHAAMHWVPIKSIFDLNALLSAYTKTSIAE